MPSAGLCLPPSQPAAPQSLLKSRQEKRKGEIEFTTASSVVIGEDGRFVSFFPTSRWEPRGGKGLGGGSGWALRAAGRGMLLSFPRRKRFRTASSGNPSHSVDSGYS